MNGCIPDAQGNRTRGDPEEPRPLEVPRDEKLPWRSGGHSQEVLPVEGTGSRAQASSLRTGLGGGVSVLCQPQQGTPGTRRLLGLGAGPRWGSHTGTPRTETILVLVVWGTLQAWLFLSLVWHFLLPPGHSRGKARPPGGYPARACATGVPGGGGAPSEEGTEVPPEKYQ